MHLEDDVVILCEPKSADARFQEGERARAASRVEAALSQALDELPADERRLLALRFGRGFTVRRIARDLGLKERPLYRLFERLLRRLRRELEARGFSRRLIRTVLDGGYDFAEMLR